MSIMILSSTDTMLSYKSWVLVNTTYCLHSVDLTRLDSNVMRSKEGVPLKHFAPWATPLSAGINLFYQDNFPCYLFTRATESKTIFLSKVKTIALFIGKELDRSDLSLRKRFHKMK